MVIKKLALIVCPILWLESATLPCCNYTQNLHFADVYGDPTKDSTAQENVKSVDEQKQKTKKLRLSRADQIPPGRFEKECSSYLEGYIQALIDANYYELNVVVEVRRCNIVYLYNLPNNASMKQSIIAFVKDIPDVCEVRVALCDYEIQKKIEESPCIRRIKGVWFPESTVLFPPLIANPREPVYSVAYRWGDKVIAENQIAVSIGDIFPIFRWFDVLPARGDMQIDIDACVWGDFNMKPRVHPNNEWAELVTTDWLLAVALSYAFDKWAFRLRAYHISSHLGDEFLCNDPTIVRVNPSFEAIDLYGSYQASTGLRLYLGPGFILHSDKSYPMKVFYIDYGFEFRFWPTRFHYHRLYGSPFIALDVQQWQAVHFRPSLTAQAGYEFSKLQGAGRKVRFFGEYHNGYSEGQFFKKITEYVAIRASWGY